MASGAANPTLVGGFVLGAIALALGGLLAFSSLDVFAKEVSYVAFFESSVTGLDVGAPVRFRGVRVGRVGDVHAVFDHGSQDIMIPVTLTFEPGTVRLDPEGGQRGSPEETIGTMIERGLKAELAMDSFVTGKLYVALEYYPDETPRYANEGVVELPEMPTTQSNIDRLVKSIAELPIDDLVDDASEALRALRELVSDPRIGSILGKVDSGLDRVGPLADSAQAALDEVRSLAANVNGEVAPTAADLRDALGSVDEGIAGVTASVQLVLAEAEAALRPLQEILGRNRELPYRVQELLIELTSASRSIRNLVDYLERHPEALIRGKR